MISNVKYKFLALLIFNFLSLKADLYDLYYAKEASFLRILPSEVLCLIAEKFLETQPFPCLNFSSPLSLISSRNFALAEEFSVDVPGVHEWSLAAFTSLTDDTIIIILPEKSNFVSMKRDDGWHIGPEERLSGDALGKLLGDGAMIAVKREDGAIIAVKQEEQESFSSKCCRFRFHIKAPTDFSQETSVSSVSERHVVLSKVPITNTYAPNDLKLLNNVDQGNLVCPWKLSFSTHEIPLGFLIATIDLKENNYVHIWSYKGNNHWQKKEILKHPHPIYSAQFNKIQNKVVTMSADGKARIWSVAGNIADCMPQKRITLEQLLFLRMINVIHNRGCTINLESIAEKLHDILSLNLQEGVSVKSYLYTTLESFGEEVKQELITRYKIIL